MGPRKSSVMTKPGDLPHYAYATTTLLSERR